MASDPRKLRPSDLCRLLNSTPLGEVISDLEANYSGISERLIDKGKLHRFVNIYVNGGGFVSGEIKDTPRSVSIRWLGKAFTAPLALIPDAIACDSGARLEERCVAQCDCNLSIQRPNGPVRRSFQPLSPVCASAVAMTPAPVPKGGVYVPGSAKIGRAHV